MTCKLHILGCSGGIGAELRTTSFLLDQDILIDAGTGVSDLSLDQLRAIDSVFLTHSHLDHICSIPFILDAVGASRSKPLTVYGIPETIDALKRHIFNNIIWPDFTKIPSEAKPFLKFHPIQIGETIAIPSEGYSARTIRSLPVNHSIPAIGYAIHSGQGTLIFSGDTGPSTAFWQAVNAAQELKHLLIETSFTDSEEGLAGLSGHLCPSLLATELKNLQSSHAQIWVSHLKPDGGKSIVEEIEHSTTIDKSMKARIFELARNQIITF
jgi:cAMP phosphodiesterase